MTQKSDEEKWPKFLDHLHLTICNNLVHFLQENKEITAWNGRLFLTRIILNYCVVAVSSLFKKQGKQCRLFLGKQMRCLWLSQKYWSKYHNYTWVLQKGGYGAKGNLQQPSTDVCAKEIHTHPPLASKHFHSVFG